MKKLPGKPRSKIHRKLKLQREFLPRQSQLRKSLSIYLVSSARASMLCGSALCFKKKTPTQRAKLSADNKLCFFCLQGNQAFRQCPRAENCIKPECLSTQKVVLYGAERVYSRRNPPKRTATSTQTSTLIKQELKHARIMRTQTLIKNHSARIHQTQV